MIAGTTCPRCRGSMFPAREEPGERRCLQCGDILYAETWKAMQAVMLVEEHVIKGRRQRFARPVRHGVLL